MIRGRLVVERDHVWANFWSIFFEGFGVFWEFGFLRLISFLETNGIIQSVPGGLLIISDALRHHWGVQFFSSILELDVAGFVFNSEENASHPIRGSAEKNSSLQCCLRCSYHSTLAELPGLQLSHCFC